MKKRVNKFGKISVVFCAMVFLLLISTGKAEAATIGMKQGILPVNFVYLDEKSHISNIWSNVKSVDEAYIVVFFDIEKEIIPSNNILLEKFANKRIEGTTQEHNRHVSFVKTKKGLEEIETIT